MRSGPAAQFFVRRRGGNSDPVCPPAAAASRPGPLSPQCRNSNRLGPPLSVDPRAGLLARAGRRPRAALRGGRGGMHLYGAGLQGWSSSGLIVSSSTFAEPWDGEARASRRSGLFEVKFGTARQERAAGAASSRSRVERRGKSEPQERPLRGQEWNGEARASRRSGLFEVKFGTARQERAAGAASSRSRVERRGKSFSVGGFELRN
ncbi:unnamed protein product [Coccothraustes coccothraustes]